MDEPTELDPRKMQIEITGFLEKKSSTFMIELWNLLVEAQESENGIVNFFSIICSLKDLYRLDNKNIHK